MGDFSELYSNPGGSESYASRYEPEKPFFTRDERIFHQPGYFYDSVARLLQVVSLPGGFRAQVELDSGEAASLEVSLAARDTLRLKLWQGQPAFQETSPMLVTQTEGVPSSGFVETGEQVELRWEDYALQIDKDPFRLGVFYLGKMIFELESEQVAGMYVTAPLGFRKTGPVVPGPPGKRWPYLSWRMRNDERFFGLGEKFNKVEKTFTRATIWEADTGGTNTTDLSYKAVPVLYSTAGWGLVLHSSYRSYWEVGNFSYTSGSFLSEEPCLDAFLFFGPTLKALIERYTALTGRPALPPAWALGIWMSRCAYTDRAQVEEVLDRLRAERIPCDVIHLDPPWMKTHYYPILGIDACDFEWDRAAWPNPQEMFASFRQRGFATCLWINPYLPEGKPIYQEAAEKGYLARTPQGGIARQEFGEPVGVVDLTNPEAKAWWKEHIKALLRLGAAVVKPDYGDRVAENALFANGKSGREMHNLFVHLYVQAAFEAVQEERGENFVWRRPGYIGSQRYPGTWAGDTQVSWQGMRGALRGGLSAGFCGDAFWTSDIGGFVGAQPSTELYIRWAQFGLLSALARFHGTSPREPWHYGPDALAIVRHYANLRYSLIPYLKALASQAAETGLPLMRHMKLEFPDEPNADTLDDQYMLGPDLLVAPILQENACDRVVYFPAGLWRRLEGPHETVSGPCFQDVPAPLETIPLYVRAGAAIPYYLEPPQHLKGDPASELGLDLFAGDAHTVLAFQEGQRVELTYHFAEKAGLLIVQPAPVVFHIRLVGWTAEVTDRSGLPLPRLAGENAWQVDAADGAVIRLKCT